MRACASNANQPKRIRKLVENSSNKVLVRLLIIIVLVVAVDQITKFWAVQHLSDKPSVEVFGSFFMLTLVFNEGGALGTSFGLSTYYLLSSTLVLLFLLYYTYANRRLPMISIPLAFIAGGAIGNIIDRIRLGRVIDFLDVDFFDVNIFGYQLNRWWTFNVADSAISCSLVFLLVYVIFFHGKKTPNPEPQAPRNEPVSE